MEKTKMLDRIQRIRLYSVVSNANSTNVKRMKYDSITRELIIEFWGDGTYTYSNVAEGLYEMIRNGDAATRTAGDWGPVGKTPSVGAAVHQYLVETNHPFTQGGTI
jgi:hypothetical protein